MKIIVFILLLAAGHCYALDDQSTDYINRYIDFLTQNKQLQRDNDIEFDDPEQLKKDVIKFMSQASDSLNDKISKMTVEERSNFAQLMVQQQIQKYKLAAKNSESKEKYITTLLKQVPPDPERDQKLKRLGLTDEDIAERLAAIGNN